MKIIPTEDQLKALGAASASSGAVAMFHMVGITPEAPTVESAFQRKQPEKNIGVTMDMLRESYRALTHTDSERLDIVVLGSPHFSLAEFKQLADEHQALWDDGGAANRGADSGLSEESEQASLGKRALDHVFTLLGLAIDAEAVELARRALSTDDAKLRGTALEYLEHVVPEAIRAAIWPHLQAGFGTGHARGRTASEIVDELKRSLG
jgi:hypothetical protein